MKRRTPLTLLALVAILAPAGIGVGQQSEGRLSVRVSNVESTEGRVGCALYDSANGFPTDTAPAIRNTWARISGSSATCVFRGLAAGTYAVSTLHDEDNDGELDTGIFGIPSEGWGVSNNLGPRGMRPPRFSDASFSFDGTEKTIRIRLRN